MARGYHGVVLRQIQRVFSRGTIAGMSEEHLLERFVARKDDAAFEALVRRHGPMVWGVCRRILVEPHDAEDAFQATFLVLLKKAGSLRDPGRLSPWLHGVAYRVATRARANASRRVTQERKAAAAEAVESESGPVDEPELLRLAIDEELDRLPEKYRRPLVLCHLEGLSYEEAARRLRWTEGMVRGRLARGRAQLRSRLTGRGLAPSAGAGLAWPLAGPVPLAVPHALVGSTVEVVSRALANQAVVQLTTAATAALVEWELKSMLMAKAKLVAFLVFAAGAITLVATGYAEIRSRESGRLPNRVDRERLLPPEEQPNAADHGTSSGLPTPHPADLLLADGPKPEEPKRDGEDDAPEGAVAITVVAKDTGKPLPGATVRALIDFKNLDHTTDGEGLTTLDLKGRKFKGAISVDVWADGYVQQRFFFTNSDPKYPRIPERWTVTLLPGEETFGGLVKDEQGRPIAGATVELWGYLGEKKDPHELAYMVRSRTDAQGRWQNRSLRGMQFVYLYLSHPDFVADDSFHARAFGSPNDRDKRRSPALDRLRNQTDEQVMSRGVELRGRILDDAGRPVVGAEVLALEEQHASTLNTDATWVGSEAEGRFVLPHVRPGKVVLVAKADGRGPALKTLEAAPGVAPIELRLTAGKILKGFVKDGAGRPIEGAFVNVDNWRGVRSLGIHFPTDAEGRFQWNSAPDDAYLLNVSKQGFMRADLKPSKFTDEEITITLNRSLEVAGTIKDAETGNPIAVQPVVERGTVHPGNGQVTWTPLSPVYVSGVLRVSMAADRSSYRIRIKALGYEPFETREFRGDEGKVTLDIALKKDSRPGFVGTVLGPDGRPVRDAELVIATKEGPVQLQRGRGESRSAQEVPIIKTDAEGRYRLPRMDVPFKLAAAHELGFARLNSEQLKKSNEVRLLPWGRVEGQVVTGSQPAVGAKVVMSSDDSHGAFWTYEDAIDERGRPTRNPVWSVVRLTDGGYQAITDKEGRFVFERVPPLDMSLSDVVGTSMAHTVYFKIEPGQTTKLTVGGTGRPVIGRVVIPDQSHRAINLTKAEIAYVRKDPWETPYPEGLSLQEKSEWLEEWWNSPAGKAHRSGMVVRPARPSPDGRFRSDDVTPGEYLLKMSFTTEDGTRRKRQVASLMHRFVVPEIPGGRSDEPIDLGDLDLKLTTLLDVGQSAPPLEFETLDGQRHTLEDYRGKYVLIDFWATWCGPCIKEIPFLKATHDAFAKEDRFTLISLSLDDEVAKPRDFLKDKDQPWIQGYVGSWSQSPVPERYEVGAIPAILLIDPSGKVVAKDLRGEAIKEAVAKALAKP